MRKWWRREHTVTVDLAGGDAAAEAKRAAEARWGEVRRVVAVVDTAGRNNHFRQRFEGAIRGEPRHRRA